MPKRAPSGTTGLFKRHPLDCPNRHGEIPSRCRCAWRGRYKGQDVVLATWSGKAVDPLLVGKARIVFDRMKTAIDEKYFDAAGEVAPLGTDQRFRDFVTEWEKDYARPQNLTANSLPSVLKLIQTGTVDRLCLGSLTLAALAESPVILQRWLDGMALERKWADVTWNRYYEQLHSIFAYATTAVENDTPRMTRNPLDNVKKRRGMERLPAQRILEDLEDKLFAKVLELNRPSHQSTRGQLTQAIADQIRVEVLDEQQYQNVVAKKYQVSPGLVCDIVNGKIWNPAKYRPSTKGDEMQRRLIAAFDTGLRAGEMMLVQLKHVNFRRPLQFSAQNGTVLTAYQITLPPENTKGGKTTGEVEYVYAGTDRSRRMLDQRRLQLKNDGEAYVFGTERGAYQEDFEDQWKRLYALAGLDHGRDKGLVWHTIRHEYISRLAEQTGDPVLVQVLARHRDLETTQQYFHVRNERLVAAAVGLNRR